MTIKQKAERDHLRAVAETGRRTAAFTGDTVLMLLDALADAEGRADRAERTLAGVEGESACSCKLVLPSASRDSRGCGRHYLLALLDETTHLRREVRRLSTSARSGGLR